MLSQTELKLNLSYPGSTKQGLPVTSHRLKVKGERKDHAYTNHKKVGLAISVSDKGDFRTGTIIRDKGQFIMVKKSIQQEGKTITPNNRVSLYK